MSPTDAPVLLSARGIRKSFGANEVLRGIDFSVRRGEVVTLIGPSGSGKTTVLRSLNVGGYAAEVIRAAILSVPKGQWEAAYTIGMSPATTLRRVILPQAARVSVPPLSNTFISLVKDTSLASLILVTELFRVAQQIAAFSQEFMLLYLEAALIYWLFCLALSGGQTRLERRLDRYVAH